MYALSHGFQSTCSDDGYSGYSESNADNAECPAACDNRFCIIAEQMNQLILRSARRPATIVSVLSLNR